MDDKRTIESLIANLTKLVESKQVISPEQWVDAATFFQILKFREQEKRLAYEMLYNRKYKEVRSSVKTAADAEIEVKTTKEYEDWRRQEELLKDIVLFTQVAKKQSDILNKY